MAYYIPGPDNCKQSFSIHFLSDLLLNDNEFFPYFNGSYQFMPFNIVKNQINSYTFKFL